MDINFLKGRHKQLNKLQLLDQKWFKISLGVLGIVVVIFVIVLSARLWIAYQVRTVISRQEQLKQRIQLLEKNEQSYVIFAAKLQVLTELLAQRKNKKEAIQYFSSLFDPSVLISNITYAADDNILSFTLKAPTIFSLDAIFSSLQQPQLKDQFEQVEKSDLRRSEDGSYSMQVTITLKQ